MSLREVSAKSGPTRYIIDDYAPLSLVAGRPDLLAERDLYCDWSVASQSSERSDLT